MTAEAFPLRTAIDQSRDGDHAVFTWATDDAPLHARYRLEWRFREPPTSQAESVPPSETMRRLGIVQEGEPILREVARTAVSSSSASGPPPKDDTNQIAPPPDQVPSAFWTGVPG